MNKILVNYIIFLLFFFSITPKAYAQVTLGSTIEPEKFSVLQIDEAISGGLRLPCLTNAEIKQLEVQIAANPSEAVGLMIYNKDNSCVQTWNSLGAWSTRCAGEVGESTCCPNPIINNGSMGNDLSLNEGQSFTFTALASGMGAENFKAKWYKDGVELTTGTITPQYVSPNYRSTYRSVTSIKGSDAGQYYCVFTNDCGTSVTSKHVKVDICVIPKITKQPVSVIAQKIGEQVILETEASGTNLQYQWYFDTGGAAQKVSGATAKTYIFNITGDSQVGNYHCKVTNSCLAAGVSSSKAKVCLLPQIKATTPEEFPLLNHGDNLTLTVDVTAGLVGGVTYRWYSIKSGGTAQPIAGTAGASATYTKLSVTSSDTGEYFCRVTNSCGAFDSRHAKVSVGCPAVSVNYDASSIAQNIAVGKTLDLKVIVGASGGGTLSYQWYRGTTAISDGTSGTGVAALISTTSGATTANLKIVNIQTSEAGKYTCKVSNQCGNSSVTNPLNIEVTCTPATLMTITGIPIAVGQGYVTQARKGDSFSIKQPVSTPGHGLASSLKYQWYKNTSEKITSATNPTYSVASAKLQDGVPYFCEVTNVCGGVARVNTPVRVKVCHDMDWYLSFALDSRKAKKSNANEAELPPPATREPITCPVGASFQIRCSANGDDEVAEMIWYKDSVEISRRNGYHIHIVTNAKTADSGRYTARIYNLCGDFYDVAPIDINVRP